MSTVSRRSFLKTSAALAACTPFAHSETSEALTIKEGNASFASSRYSFHLNGATGIFSVFDGEGRSILTAPLQPVVTTSPSGDQHLRVSQTGSVTSILAERNVLKLHYGSVNGNATLAMQVRFQDDCFWIDPPIYDGAGADDQFVSLHYFASVRESDVLPGLHATYTTIPGISETTAISPIQGELSNLTTSVSLGRAGFYVSPFLHQQWGLPVHYFCATSTTAHATDGGRLDAFTARRTATAICGLADLPNGDVMFDYARGRSTLWIDYRSDIWRHMPAGKQTQIGCTLMFAFAEDQRSAAIAYGEQLVHAGIIEIKKKSAAKNKIVFAPEFCTWGAQVVRDAGQKKLDQKFIEGLYAEMKASGMKAGIFSIDDKWEGRYGNLTHDAERFPGFVEFLDHVRDEGHPIGLWTAFLRCERPDDLGLTTNNMLQTVDGQPYMGGHNAYYLLDFTQPEVAKVLTERARNFMRVYKPALVKFDFGYELPAMRTASPADKKFSGERLLQLGLDIVIGALRSVNPDVVVMYYQLSPLFAKYFDLHSTDDMFITAGDYDLEANRRIYLGSTLTPLGVATYGSSGYDWSSSPAIWFDSVVAGTVGSINDFKGDEFGDTPSADQIALYNGMAKAIRADGFFDVITYPPVRPESSTRGLHTRSWARSVGGKIVMVAQRPASFDDGDSIDHRAIDPRVANLVKTDVPVVLSSSTEEALAASRRITIVPCGTGQVSLRRQNGQSASVTTFYFGGTSKTTEAKIKNGWLMLNVTRASAGKIPVEYLDVSIH